MKSRLPDTENAEDGGKAWEVSPWEEIGGSSAWVKKNQMFFGTKGNHCSFAGLSDEGPAGMGGKERGSVFAWGY